MSSSILSRADHKTIEVFFHAKNARATHAFPLARPILKDVSAIAVFGKGMNKGMSLPKKYQGTGKHGGI